MFKNLTTALILGISGLAIALPACSESLAESTPQEEVMESAGIDMPQLLPRSEGLGSPDEIARVNSVYDRNIATLKANPDDANARIRLAELFINEARITGEHPHYYPLALDMVRGIPAASLQKEDEKFKAKYLEASVLLSLHQFREAYEKGMEARNIFPTNAGIHGVLVDARVEMGRYDDAVQLCDQMVNMRPDLRSYSRVSYLREIHGETAGAIEAMDMAVKAGVPGYEQTAWCRLTLAELHKKYGTIEDAEMHYKILLSERPNYPFAIAGLAGVEMERQNYAEAEALLDQAIALIPEVGFYEDKARLMELTDRKEEAKKLYPQIIAMMEEDAAAGHIMDLEMAMVHLEMGNNAKLALEHAQKAAQGRLDNIEVNYALAKIYAEMGESDKAKMHLEKALATGSKDPDYLALAKNI